MRLLAVTLVLTSSLFAPGRADACGGGLVSTKSVAVSADAQRIFLAAAPASTTVVTQVTVPATTADYGVLIPLPAQPTLDPQPVPSAAFDDLDAATAPHLLRTEPSSGGFSLGCGGGASKAGVSGGAVSASDPVEIGPVTAVTLTADDGTALSDWLAANGFALPDDGKALVDAYAGAGRFFIALKRSTRATDGAPSSVGVRFTLPGDQRVLPLKFARLGAAASVAFTVFIAAAQPSGPEAPFEGLSLSALEVGVVAHEGYPAAIEQAVAAKKGRAFVLESVRPRGGLSRSNPLLASLGDDVVITRLSTIIRRDDLTADANLAGDAPASVPGSITVPAQAATPLALLVAALVLAGASRGRRSRRVDSVS